RACLGLAVGQHQQKIQGGPHAESGHPPQRDFRLNPKDGAVPHDRIPQVEDEQHDRVNRPQHVPLRTAGTDLVYFPASVSTRLVTLGSDQLINSCAGSTPSATHSTASAPATVNSRAEMSG